jgi:curved DNA-binding protein CbpA
LAADENSPYDVVGINWKMSSDNIKKRYWKLSLLVHPDKCPHPSAQEAFVKLNNAFKDLQDPEKRGVIDEKIKKKEEMEQFEVELKAMREAAEWRRLQGKFVQRLVINKNTKSHKHRKNTCIFRLLARRLTIPFSLWGIHYWA